jgi:NOL1/NOP2/sun family putative RNA methylase
VLKLPEKFIDKVRSLLPDEADLFFEAITNNPVTTIRLNPFKKTDAFYSELDVPWTSNAKYFNKRPSFVADPLFHAGVYYVQEASSMFLSHIINQISSTHNKQSIVLDLCAAPGGKSTLLLDHLNDDSLLVANEIIKSRVNVLEENCIKWGRSNVLVTNNDPKDFTSLTNFFDIIVVDAPCSGEGMFRKDKNAINEWSEENVQLCSNRQQRILSDVIPALKPGGFIVYSTCTFNTCENEDNVIWMEKEFGLKSIEIPFNKSWGIETASQSECENIYGYRFYPHKVMSEGFFISCLQKPKEETFNYLKIPETKVEKVNAKDLDILREWVKDIDLFQIINASNTMYALPQTLSNKILFLRSKLNVRLSGLKLGQIINNKLIPDHQLALSIHINDIIPSLQVEKTNALKFLRKDTFEVPSVPQNTYLVKYQNTALGWVKVMPNRMNNYLPVNWRILKDLKDLLEE